MALPDIAYRKLAYKAVLALIPAVGAVASVGVLTVSQAGIIVGILGWLGSLLAERASTQLQKDGTLILTGSVEDQVAKGIEILTKKATDSVEALDRAGSGLDILNQAKTGAINAAGNIPVLGPITQAILKDILK
jgi:hypothetical protein